MISKKRLIANFEKMSTFSSKGEGITRLAYSDEDWQARDFVISLMKEAGLAVRTDNFGNVMARREGKKSQLPVVMFGSHIDSVPNGGNYDGVFGVLAAIEVVNALNDADVLTEHPLEVAVFMAEESSRFGNATLGSKVMAGLITKEKLQEIKDKDNNSLYDVLKSRNLDADNVLAAKYTAPIKAFLEIHIEQGKVLEEKNIPIGVVTGIAAPTRLKVFLNGHADHSGATPMDCVMMLYVRQRK